MGVSYAWWSHIVSQEGINTIQSTCLEITLTDENPISLQNAYPITDYEASLLTPYTFTITNTCNTAVEYDVNLDIMESSNRLNSSYIAVEFNGESKKLLNTFESVETSYPGSDYTPVEARYLTSGELSANESKTYTIKLWMDESVTVEDDAMNKSFISKVVVTAKQSHIVRLVDYILSETNKDFEVFTHEATSQTIALTDYRYTGANPNNYVYFGCEDACIEDNLYRIIGVIPTQGEVGGPYENRVKLIKNSYFTNTKYFWGASKTNNQWDSSPMKVALNNSYYNTLGEYQKYIVSSVWYLGAPTYSNTNSNVWESYTPEKFYNLERSSTRAYAGGNLNTIANIGLMYPSDYAYSLGSNFINESVYTNANKYIENAWLYNANGGFTISPEATWYMTNRSALAWFISEAGYMPGNYVYYEGCDSYLKPTFYLKESVIYKSGSGTQENPYRISINE